MPQTKKTCPKCEDVRLTRIARLGFFQERVYPRFGRYPWECGQCRKVFLLKSRGIRVRKNSTPLAAD